MLTKAEIETFCSQHDYDIRKSRNGRWIDQKCAADVVCFIADCITNYINESERDDFTVKDIWYSDFPGQRIKELFKKPDVNQSLARHEYDKFFQQPMEMFANAGILHKTKKGRTNVYHIVNYDVLEYLAMREGNSLFFLKTYVEKVLKDSGLYGVFDSFFKKQTKASYSKMKSSFSKFIIRNTKINGEVECNRIFIKVLNPLAFYKNCCGTERGHMSKNPITYDMLMYNRNNFRDLYSNKPKGMTRKAYAASHPVTINVDYYKYQSNKAKKYLRIFNDRYRDCKSEHLEKNQEYDQAIHMHHIFPESDFPEICFYLENLIALTPTQHLSYAHPQGRTQEIDEQYQHLLLLSKIDRIDENLSGQYGEIIYSFVNMLYVLSIGFDDDSLKEIATNDFNSVKIAIDNHYIP